MIVTKTGPFRTIPLFDLEAKHRGPRLRIDVQLCNYSNTPHVSVETLAVCLRAPNKDIKPLLKEFNIPIVKIKYGVGVRDFLSLENFIEALASLPAIQNSVSVLERIYTEAKSVAFRRRVFKALDIAFDDDCYPPLKTTAGEYMCCGAYSFKPIAKASFE